jgi:hypothetical protein
MFSDSELRKTVVNQMRSRSLVALYGVPPFSIFDCKQGYWQQRKAEWIAMGIKSELGRGGDLIAAPGCAYSDKGSKIRTSPGGQPRPCTSTKNGKTQRGDGQGRRLASTEGTGQPSTLHKKYKESASINGLVVSISPNAYSKKDEETSAASASGTSIFDPVLCEIMYNWFCPKQGAILDPFAGGSVRGLVASTLGFSYTGIDLSKSQIEANRQQATEILGEEGTLPTWIEGNSLKIHKLVNSQFDFIFSCPPYMWLEKYSDNPSDLSTMKADDFFATYEKIISRSLIKLKDNRFACFVVGNVRDPKQGGRYLNLPMKTIQLFEKHGAVLYNDAIMITAIASLPLRVGRQFKSARKLGMTHQHVLVFLKGDYKKAVAAINGDET